MEIKKIEKLEVFCSKSIEDENKGEFVWQTAFECKNCKMYDTCAMENAVGCDFGNCIKNKMKQSEIGMNLRNKAVEVNIVLQDGKTINTLQRAIKNIQKQFEVKTR